MKDISAQKDTDLTRLLAEKREELRKARFDAVGGKVKDPAAHRATKRDVARILTELRTRRV